MSSVGFELTPLTEVSPWGADVPCLHWFGFTDWQYWIELGSYFDTPDTLELVGEDCVPGHPYVDYFVAPAGRRVLAGIAEGLTGVGTSSGTAWNVIAMRQFGIVALRPTRAPGGAERAWSLLPPHDPSMTRDLPREDGGEGFSPWLKSTATQRAGHCITRDLPQDR